MGGGDSPQQYAALQAEGSNYAQMEKALGIATPALKGEIGYIKGALGGGEPGYVKQGYNAFEQNLKDQSRTSAGADDRAAMAGKSGLQALSALGKQSGLGAGRGAAATSEGKLSEGQAMFTQTQSLLATMGGAGVGALGTAAQISAQQAQAISHMQDYNSTTATVLGALSTAGSLYGAFQGITPSYDAPSAGDYAPGYGPSGFTGPTNISFGGGG